MYAVAAALGIAGRLDWAETPAWLQQPWVIVAIVLFAVEFVVDKVPAVDSVGRRARGDPPDRGATLMAGADADAGTVALAALGDPRPLVAPRQGHPPSPGEHLAGTRQQRRRQRLRGRAAWPCSWRWRSPTRRPPSW